MVIHRDLTNNNGDINGNYPLIISHGYEHGPFMDDSPIDNW